MVQFQRLTDSKAQETAQAVAAALDQGLVVAPVFGGLCVLGRRPDELTRAFGAAHRVVAGLHEVEAKLSGLEPAYRSRVLRVMAGPVVARFDGSTGHTLAAGGFERCVREAVRGELWLGVPEDAALPGELADELGRSAALVVTADGWQPGPTVLDFGRRPAGFDRKGKLGILDSEAALGEVVRLGRGISFSVLAVCTGNSCRSPMAAGLLSKLTAGLPVFVCSAGTDAPVGSPATAAAIETGRRAGFDLGRHRAQQLDAGTVRGADLILVMDHYHQERVVEMIPDAATRTRLLLSYAGRADDEVADPIGRPLEAYEQTLGVMRPALESVADEIRRRCVPEVRAQ